MIISVVAGKNESEIIDKFEIPVIFPTDRKARTRGGAAGLLLAARPQFAGAAIQDLVVGTDNARGARSRGRALPAALSHRLLMPAISASNSLAAAKPVGVLCCPNNARGSPL
jgi:hypothetical protein